jgi:hypothetical protein
VRSGSLVLVPGDVPHAYTEGQPYKSQVQVAVLVSSEHVRQEAHDSHASCRLSLASCCDPVPAPNVVDLVLGQAKVG